MLSNGNSPPTSAFVYPVRSLLKSEIQPAPSPVNAVAVDISARDDPVAQSTKNDSVDPGSASAANGAPDEPPTLQSDPQPKAKGRRKRSRKKHDRANVPNPNYRHFPGEDSPKLRRTFTASLGLVKQPDVAPEALAFLVVSPSVSDVAAPFAETKPLDGPPPEPRARPKQVPVSDDPLPPEEVPDVPGLEWNPSQMGVVHLAPLPSSSSLSFDERASSVVFGSFRGHPSQRKSPSRAGSTPSLPEAPVGASDGQAGAAQLLSVARGGAASRCSASESHSGTGSLSGSDASDASQLIAVRFQHHQDENGHHIIVGREGQLARCEDEPIRTPGAVQGFGVLIVVDELDDMLVVRQVSENSEEILGLPPHYLFSLNCFTDTLSDSQAGILWDNIQFLSDSDPNSHDEEASPHVFLLTGWGAPGSASPDDQEASGGRRSWTCWCAVHRPSTSARHVIMEFELERDVLNPLYPSLVEAVPEVGSPDTGSSGASDTPGSAKTVGGSTDSSSQTLTPGISDVPAFEIPTGPSAEDILESTTSRAKPLPALERLRRMARPELVSPGGANPRSRRRTASGSSTGGVGMMDVFAVMAQINEQLGQAPDLTAFLQVVVGVIKDLSQFHRVLVYQFDEAWNGQVVAELLDWSKTHDLYRGLHFPASDIPAQARQLYAINKVRLLYDRSQSTARIVVRSKDDLQTPVDMTHCYLRAMSPIHIQYLENMGVRASMSISIMSFGTLWGLVTCHSYGAQGMRVSFPVRQMMRLLSQSISRNIERLSYAQRLTTKRLINTMASDNHPTGYIVSNADDLLGLFDADFGVLVIGQAAKMLGPSDFGQEILIIAEYLRLKQFATIQVTQQVKSDYEELVSAGLDVIAGMLYVPLSSEGKDFICFLRKGQPRHVHWAGNPNAKTAMETILQPRKSFAVWSETLAGRCRAWSSEQLETAGVLALVYGKFIEVWRQKENALQTTRLTNLLLSNASHEVRTPLNHIINYLEMALNGPLDDETRDNLNRSHAASKSLLFTINDLLDLTRLESGNETSFNEPFDLQTTIEDAIHLYRKEAVRRNLDFNLRLGKSPKIVVGDIKKIRTVVQNITANALKFTSSGAISVTCAILEEPEGIRGPDQVAVEIIVEDTGCGIPADKLATLFREFEQVESMEPSGAAPGGVGLGLAVVARIVEQLGGQLRVESKVNEGSCFSFMIPMALPQEGDNSTSSSRSSLSRSRKPSSESIHQIDSLVEALSSSHMVPNPGHPLLKRADSSSSGEPMPVQSNSRPGTFDIPDSNIPVCPVKIDGYTMDSPIPMTPSKEIAPFDFRAVTDHPLKSPVVLKPILPPAVDSMGPSHLRVLIVEDNDINRTVLAKRLRLDGHSVVTTTNGQEALDKVTTDRCFDAIFMDIQMPILDGYQATERIRALEKATPDDGSQSLAKDLNGGHIPIFAVSASLKENRREELADYGIDGWILKPIDFKRLKIILKGVIDLDQRQANLYRPGCSWEAGGWLLERSSPPGEPPPT